MRIDELKRRLGDRVNIEWKSFLLRTEPKVKDLDKFIQYTTSWQTPAELEPAASFTTPWGSGSRPPLSSLPAQVAWKASAMFGPHAQDLFHHSLLDAYFVQNRDISDFDELFAIAGACDLDPTEFKAVLDEHHVALAQQVWADHNDAVMRNITAVPSLVLGGSFVVPGAQDVETYERLVNRLIERRAGRSAPGPD